jgi:hypothetical protein
MTQAIQDIKGWQQARSQDRHTAVSLDAGRLTRCPIQDTIHFEQTMWQIRTAHAASVETSQVKQG